MKTMTVWFLLLMLLPHFVNGSVSPSSEMVHDGNVCTRIESVKKAYVVPKTQKVKERYTKVCFGIPPFCDAYRWKTVTVNETVIVNQTRIAYDCCKGYEKVDGSCVPFCRLGCGHGECVEPDVCLCDEGWREPYCTNECEPNRYGKGCVHNCTCFNGGTCSKRDGSCSCIEGFIGAYCELPCPDNWYGMDCREKCKCQNGAMCDIKDGSCECEPGYYGEYCENPCELGSHGKDCKFVCVCLPETTSTCNPIDGQCICRPGFEGEFCEFECGDFTYGRDCQYKCDCVNAEFCNPVDGRCICKPGWTGKNCSEPCPQGKFGHDCYLKCANCSSPKGTCNPVTGYCDCPPGSFGTLCELSCLEGFWGPNCSKSCKCLDNEVCDPITGECTCSPGWKLPNCSDSCSSGWFGYNCSFECNCTNGKSCNATTGHCYSALHASYKKYDSSTSGLIGLLIGLMVITGIIAAILWIFRQEISEVVTSFREVSSKGVTECCQTSTSTDNILAENFTNPMYVGSNAAQSADSAISGSAVMDDVSHPKSALEKLQSHINSFIAVDEKESKRCSQNASEVSKENEDITETSHCSDMDIKSDLKEFRQNLRSHIKETEPTKYPGFRFEEDFEPAVLSEFNIPDDETYEKVLIARRSLENTYANMPSQQ